MLNPPSPAEIWLALIADPNGKYRKIRPVLILKPMKDKWDEFDSAQVLGITTKVDHSDAGDEYVLQANKTNGLSMESAIKFFWVDVVPSNAFDKRLGTLTREEFAQAMKMFQEFHESDDR
jgi:mRNA-degrading endonuclease toxin of MazEF toxin-antitoxin module